MVGDEYISELPHSFKCGTISRVGAHTMFKGLNEEVIRLDTNGNLDITLPAFHQGQTNGLCGNFDLNPTNDNLGLPASDLLDLFNLDPNSVPVDERHTDPCNFIPDHDRDSIEMRCEELSAGERFQDCFSAVYPENYFYTCLFSMCYCTAVHGLRSCATYCDVFTIYSRACSEKGVVLDWRTDEMCPVECENGMEYTECGSPCPRTCANLDFEDECDQYCVDGCQCPTDPPYNVQEPVVLPDVLILRYGLNFLSVKNTE
ncbi:von Willebrand factor-like [Asterias amurensis]|uniref:von Willebrand factor-like n=1 Tax=Asterias amurensis TaxID=7602 RepID=UPI003AB8D783